MKKYLLLALCFCFCFWFGHEAHAGEFQASWEYPDVPPDLVGFELYVDGISVWKGIDPLQRTCQFTCSVTGEPVNFTITAYDAVNESKHSEVCRVDPPPVAPMSLTVVESE